MFDTIKKTKIYQKLIAYREERIDHKQFLHRYGNELRALKDSYRGQRCFIIGNGPSLRAEDLEKLKDEVTFASNFIIKIFDQTDWRPTFFCNSDLGVLAKLKEEAAFWEIPAKNCFFQYNSRFILGEKYPAGSICYYLREAKDYGKLPRFSTKIDDEIYDAFTVTYITMQIANYMGFKEIYLLGIDNNYANSVSLSGQRREQMVFSHFYSRSKGGTDDDGGAVPNIDRMNMGYLSAKKFTDQHDLCIYNATRGGKLETFERVDLDNLLNSNKEDKK